MDKHSGRCAREDKMRHSVHTDQMLEEVALFVFFRAACISFHLLQVENDNF